MTFKIQTNSFIGLFIQLLQHHILENDIYSIFTSFHLAYLLKISSNNLTIKVGFNINCLVNTDNNNMLMQERTKVAENKISVINYLDDLIIGESSHYLISNPDARLNEVWD